jgi:hypothetical protein
MAGEGACLYIKGTSRDSRGLKFGLPQEFENEM